MDLDDRTPRTHRDPPDHAAPSAWRRSTALAGAVAGNVGIVADDL
jgi:hypothetical protein